MGEFRAPFLIILIDKWPSYAVKGTLRRNFVDTKRVKSQGGQPGV